MDKIFAILDYDNHMTFGGHIVYLRSMWHHLRHSDGANDATRV